MDGALCGACAVEVEFVVKVIALCERHVVEEEEKKVLAGDDVQDLPKFNVSTSNGLTVVPWRSAVAC